MKLARFLVFASLVIMIGCTMTYMASRELLYAEILNPDSLKGNTPVLLKIDGYKLFQVNAYQLRLVATGRYDKAHLLIERSYKKDNMFIEYAEIDLPDLAELQRWRNALDKNEPVILYSKTDIFKGR